MKTMLSKQNWAGKRVWYVVSFHKIIKDKTLVCSLRNIGLPKLTEANLVYSCCKDIQPELQYKILRYFHYIILIIAAFLHPNFLKDWRWVDKYIQKQH